MEELLKATDLPLPWHPPGLAEATGESSAEIGLLQRELSSSSSDSTRAQTFAPKDDGGQNEVFLV